ncbi:helix-turn-helix domain-containing protein [Primorskyibacter sp. S87]|uniref:helix-turn-helix domain-containing protein n=1 Tax=Primorskyibacter sp. S87 TaxID=3415126 RepID=UPI003C7C17E8
MPGDLTKRLSHHLKGLRSSRGWSLDQLAELSGISRASLSRLEHGEVSPTAETLGQLCAAYDLSVSRLLIAVEESFAAKVSYDQQPVWTDPLSGFARRSVSPMAPGLTCEVLECHLQPGTRITYESPPRQGQEHHLILREGALTLTISRLSYSLTVGDSLRYHLSGPSSFETSDDQGARYLLVLA